MFVMEDEAHRELQGESSIKIAAETIRKKGAARASRPRPHKHRRYSTSTIAYRMYRDRS